jgi:hypothetical protein
LVGIAALFVAPTAAFGAIQLNGHTDDNVIRGRRNSQPQDANGIDTVQLTGSTLKVGAVNSGDVTNSGRVAVYVFKLPYLGANVNPFQTASLTFRVGLVDANTTNADLYGLPSRASSSVLATDYYLGNNDTTNATKLQDNILHNTTPDVLENTFVSSSTIGSAALLSYLNDEYAAGAGAGEYVFLRLNPDANMGTTISNFGYNVYTANAPINDPVNLSTFGPYITFTAIPEPSAWLTWSLIGLIVGGIAGRRCWL